MGRRIEWAVEIQLSFWGGVVKTLDSGSAPGLSFLKKL